MAFEHGFTTSSDLASYGTYIAEPGVALGVVDEMAVFSGGFMGSLFFFFFFLVWGGVPIIEWFVEKVLYKCVDKVHDILH